MRSNTTDTQLPRLTIAYLMGALLTFFYFVPFLAAIWLANQALRRPGLRALNAVYLLMLSALGAAAGVVIVIVALIGAADPSVAQLGAAASGLLPAGAVMLLCAALSAIALLPSAGRWVSRWLPIEPGNPVHLAALSLTALALGFNFVQSILVLPLLLESDLDAAAVSVSYLDVLIFPLLVFLLAGLLGVGWLSRRDQQALFERLGLRPLTLRQLAITLLVTAVLLGMAIGTEALWRAIDPVGLEKIGGLSEALLGDLSGLTGALAIGLAAAIGEEVFFRGAYQPRMGLLLTTLLFTSFHTQYGFTIATVVVVVVGLVFGILRRRFSLTACVLAHFVYNFVLVLIA